jgi:uncharacterized protein (DUF1330 family)
MTSHATSTRRTLLATRHDGEPIERNTDVRTRGRGAQGEPFLVARFRAPDYARMKRAFDHLQPLLERHGARGHRIFRLADDPRDYMIVIEFASLGGARGFTKEPDLSRTIDAAGVEGGAHHVQYHEELREQLEAVDYPL